MKFLELIKKANQKLVLEADAPPPDAAPPGDVTGGDQGAEAPAAAAPAPEQPETKIDTPASIVRLTRLLKQALTIKMSDDDVYFITQLPEINENNAIAVEKMMIPVMKKYVNTRDMEAVEDEENLNGPLQGRKDTYAYPKYGNEGRVLTPGETST